MIETLETERLWLKPLTIDDAPAVQQLFPHWEIVKYLANVCPWPVSRRRCADIYSRPSTAADGARRAVALVLAIENRAGAADRLGHTEKTDRRKLGGDRGFWIGTRWQGRGLMTAKRPRRWTRTGIEVLKFPVLRTSKALANVASRRVSAKNGMRVVRMEERDYVSGRLMSEVCEITVEEWRARRERRG